jgi:TRAP-type C4-dicarboxylate transport system substrate-binding protein
VKKIITAVLFCFMALMMFGQQKKEPKYLYKIASEVPGGSLWHKTLMEVNRELMAKTNGEVGLRVYAGGIMGNQDAIIDKMKIGQIQGATFSNTGMQTIYKDFGIVGFPLTLRNQEEYDYLVEKKGKFFEDEFKKRGYKFLCWTETGPIYIYSKKQVNTIPTLQTSKPYILPGDIISEVLLKELKTTPIPVQISDILTSLKTGQIDTVFSPPYALLAMQWAPSVSYATDFIITFMVGSVMVDVKMFESMPKEYQDVMEKLFREKIDALKYNVRRDNAAAQEVLRKSGIKFVEVPQDQAKAFYEVGEKTSEYLIEKYGFSNELYQEIKTLMTDYRKNKK